MHYGTFGNKLCPVSRISSNRLLIHFSVQPIKKALFCKFSKGAVGLDFYLSKSPWPWLWRRDFCDGAKMCRADLENGALHIGEVLCHTLAHCEHLFGPSRKWISRSDDWNQLTVVNIQEWIRSEDWNLVHQTLSVNRAGTMSDVCDRLVTPRAVAHTWRH